MSASGNAFRERHREFLREGAFGPVYIEPWEDRRRLMPAVDRAAAPQAVGPVQSLMKRKICALRAQLYGAGCLPRALAMTAVLHDVLMQHHAFARRRLAPVIEDLRSQWTAALAAQCAAAQSAAAHSAPDALYLELLEALLERLHGEALHTSHMVCQVWIVDDMMACAEPPCTARTGPGVLWCLTHGAEGAAALLRAHARAFEFALDWHEHALCGYLTAADEREMYGHRRETLYHNMHILLRELDWREQRGSDDGGLVHTSLLEHAQEVLQIQREEYTAMNAAGPRDPHLSVLGRLPDDSE